MASSSSFPRDSRSVSNVLNRDKVQPEIPQVTPHDIFLSHSGAQKQFVKDLYKELSDRSFNTFFDLTHHSLPLAESFPERIFHAAKSCKLGVVVLSEEFVSSKWPMLELSAFVKADRVKILPLFFKLSPADLKNNSNLERWGKAWEDLAKQDTRIKVTEWGEAIKALCKRNGLAFNGQGEKAYLSEVVSGICEIMPVPIKFGGPHIHGMERLVQIILDTFETLEPYGKVTVLGLYGLPGSGKSTLCKCLSQYFYPIYGGRSVYVPLPSNSPTQLDLFQAFKELLKLTDFNDRFNISELEQLLDVLPKYQLGGCRAFLVIDNISDGSWEAVQMFLPLIGLRPGSKVVLVARTFDILRPVFCFLKQQYKQHYILEEMQIPSIEETEAIEILLQPSGVGPLALIMDGHRETIVRIVHMGNFGSKDHPEYLPLVMKAMGAMLIKYDGDFTQWGHDMQNFWERVDIYKEEAVKMVVKESFKALPAYAAELQLLFLDLTLFILPVNHRISLQEVCVLLSSMYGGCSVAYIELRIKDLERHCFLTTCSEFIRSNEFMISVHDVYLEFAESLSKDPSRLNYMSLRNYSWRNDKYTGAKDGKVLSLKEVTQGMSTGSVEHQQARTMILEVQGDGYERVELQGFSCLKALAVRKCQSLRVLGLLGLSSLASLDILDCPNFRDVDSGDSNVKRLTICSPQAGDNAGGQAGATGGITVQALLYPLARIHQWLWVHRQPSSGVPFARNMRGLQVLTLQNTGVRRLLDMSSCWPQLQNLTVSECFLEEFEVGNLPNLKRFHFDDNRPDDNRSDNDNRPHDDYHADPDSFFKYYSFGFGEYSSFGWMQYGGYSNERLGTNEYRKTQIWERKIKDSPRFMLKGKGLLEGCPQVNQVQINSAFFEKGELGALPPNMESLELSAFYPAEVLPDLSPSAHTLKQVRLQWCEKLEKISFLLEFGKLQILTVAQCHSLEELSGLHFLFSLRSLYVWFCSNLRAILGPFHNLKMLEHFVVEECPKLRGLPAADLENLVSIEHLTVPLELENRRFNLKNLQKLRNLFVQSRQRLLDADEISDCSTSTNIYTQQLAGGLMVEGLEDLINLERVSLNGTHVLHHARSSDLHSHGRLSTKPARSLSFSWLVGLDQKHAQTQLGILLPSTSHFSRRHKFLSCSRTLFQPKGLLPSTSHFSMRPNIRLPISSLFLANLSDLGSMDGCQQHLLYLIELGLHYLENLTSLQGLESLVPLSFLTLQHCPMLEQLPSLHTLVNLSQLTIEHCSKLKSVEGLDPALRSGKLETASFQGCESLVRLPVSVDALREREREERRLPFTLWFVDCKFADTEAMMMWAVNEDMPSSLQKLSFKHLRGEYKKCSMEDSSLPEVLFDGMFPALLNRFIPDDNQCYDFDSLILNITLYHDSSGWLLERVLESAAVRELQEKMGSVAKKDLVQKFQAHPECKLLMVPMLLGILPNELQKYH